MAFATTEVDSVNSRRKGASTEQNGLCSLYLSHPAREGAAQSAILSPSRRGRTKENLTHIFGHYTLFRTLPAAHGRTTSIPWSKTRAGGKKSGALYSAPLFPIACAALFCSADEMSASADNGLSHCGQRKSVTVPQIGFSVPLFVGSRRRFQGGRLPAGAKSRAALPSRLPQNCARFCPLPSTGERGHSVALRATPRSNPPIASDGAK